MVTAGTLARVETLATQGGRDTAGANGIPATPIELSWGREVVTPTLAHAKKPGRSTSGNRGVAVVFRFGVMIGRSSFTPPRSAKVRSIALRARGIGSGVGLLLAKRPGAVQITALALA
jgi:hypothetical protein